MTYHWDFSFLFRNLDFILAGLWNTLVLSALCVLTGAIVGAGIALMRISSVPPLRWPAIALVELLRNTPPLVQLLWLFYALPILTGVQIDNFSAALLAFSLYTAVFLSEIYRSGIAAVDVGQWEAARAIGMRRRQQLWLIAVPQMLPQMMPAFVNQVIDVVKLTSIAALLPYTEFVYSVKVVADQSYRPLEAYTALAVGFAALLLPVLLLSFWLERRVGQRIRS